MAERPITRIVGEVQYGLVAPLRDRNRVGRLMSVRLGTRFGLAIFDTDAQAGLLANLLQPYEFRALEEKIPILKGLGAKYVKVQTRGLSETRVWGEHWAIGYAFIQGRQLSMDNLVLRLQDEGLNVEENSWQELGYAEHVSLSFPNGLEGVTPGNMIEQTIDIEEFNRAERQRQTIEYFTQVTDPRMAELTCAYSPNLL